MTTILNLKNRRCRNRAPHEAHSWRGLNTRGAGYYCVGRVPPWPIDPAYPFSAVDVRASHTPTPEPPQ